MGEKEGEGGQRGSYMSISSNKAASSNCDKNDLFLRMRHVGEPRGACNASAVPVGVFSELGGKKRNMGTSIAEQPTIKMNHQTKGHSAPQRRTCHVRPSSLSFIHYLGLCVCVCVCDKHGCPSQFVCSAPLGLSVGLRRELKPRGWQWSKGVVINS